MAGVGKRAVKVEVRKIRGQIMQGHASDGDDFSFCSATITKPLNSFNHRSGII